MRDVQAPYFLTIALILSAVGVVCCAPTVVPKELEGQVDRKATYLQLKEAPQSYTGRLVVL